MPSIRMPSIRMPNLSRFKKFDKLEKEFIEMAKDIVRLNQYWDILDVNGNNSHSDNKMIETAQTLEDHPYSINQPVIQRTNPGQHDFE